MTTTEQERERVDDPREQACTRFLEPTNAAYIGKINDNGDIRSALFDDEGEPLAIGSEITLRQVAVTNGFVVVSRH
ncbi:hypothetical protein DXT97_12505 [Agrobacterium tumefaciens]|uniref:hypothetical protein n=1 Tax=Agrobacterium tumefaciens TaxID=358 RepID=UPI0012973B1B|nr:hypothetical protein [Agrobacterium tumefaciens]MQB37613.1 hypothetical protein [Agrobacterium tumefaciens]